jgi:hypothetical protein
VASASLCRLPNDRCIWSDSPATGATAFERRKRSGSNRGISSLKPYDADISIQDLTDRSADATFDIGIVEAPKLRFDNTEDAEHDEPCRNDDPQPVR